MTRARWSALASVALVAGLAALAALGERNAGASPPTFSLTSPAFAANGEIPPRYTCDGEDVSAELRWTGAPDGTASLVLIVDDPDAPDPAAPRVTWVHWILYDIPPDATRLPEAVAPTDLPPGTRQGRNDWKRTGYSGPCPPIGRHRYVYELYALSAPLGDLGEPTRAELERAMRGKVLAQTQLVGTYAKQR